MSSIGSDVSAILPDVVRQLFTDDAQLKRLTHMCLTLHGDDNPEIVLLCVNALLKDLTDRCPLTRGLAVRTVCLINNREVSEHALGAILRACSDSSVYVRKSAAVSFAIFKVFVEADHVSRFLSDAEPSVVSTALMALSLLKTNATHADFLHSYFRKLTENLSNFDLVGQYYALRLLQEYCTQFFAANSSSQDLLQLLEAVEDLVEFTPECVIVQLGTKLLAENNRQINPLVIAKHVYRLPTEFVSEFLNRTNFYPTNQPELFFINIASDPVSVWEAKIKLIRKCVDSATAPSVLAEISDYFRAASQGPFVAECVALVVHIANICPELLPACLRGLIGRVLRIFPNEAVAGIKKLATENDSATNAAMAHNLKYMTSPEARIEAVWFLTRYHDSVALLVPNALRTLAQTLPTDAPEVKLQTVILAKTVIDFHTHNAVTQKTSAVPSHVSAAILVPMKQLVEYIYAIGNKDPIVGSMVNAAKLVGTAIANEPVTTPTFVICTMARPATDSSDTLREPPKSITKLTDSKYLSSEQTAVNSTIHAYILVYTF